MEYKAYPFSINEDNLHFRFLSVGKRGVFEKVVVFSHIENKFYNLALLDRDPLTQDYSDRTISDNGDMPEILATVLSIMIEFLDKRPECSIYLTGNSASRTRLYQIAINKILPDIGSEIFVYGLLNSNWIEFEPNKTFEGFLVSKKNLF